MKIKLLSKEWEIFTHMGWPLGATVVVVVVCIIGVNGEKHSPSFIHALG